MAVFRIEKTQNYTVMNNHRLKLRDKNGFSRQKQTINARTETRTNV